VARVALALLWAQRDRHVDVVAAVLPQRDAAAHRGDVLVAEVLLHRVGGERRAAAARAVEDHALRAVTDGALDARLEMAARHVDGAGDVGLLELVLLAHVDDHGAVAVLPELVDVLRVHLLDLLLDLADEFCARCHYFRKDSGAQRQPGRPFGRPGRRPRPRLLAEAPAVPPA
jgi:hypothetical protein